MKRNACYHLIVVLMSMVFVWPTVLLAVDDVTLETSLSCFELGDTVSFTLTNNRDSTIYMPHDPPWTIYDASADTLIYPSIVFWVIVELDGDSSETYTWDQNDYHFNPVAAGKYWVEISYSEQEDPWSLITVADTFDIKVDCSGTAVDPSSWSFIKRLFR